MFANAEKYNLYDLSVKAVANMDELQVDIEKGVHELDVKKNCARSGVIFGKRLRLIM